MGILPKHGTYLLWDSWIATGENKLDKPSAWSEYNSFKTYFTKKQWAMHDLVGSAWSEYNSSQT